MKGYVQINSGQGINTIAETIEGQINQYKPREIRYVHIHGTKFMYTANILEGVLCGEHHPLVEIPKLVGFEFKDGGSRIELDDLLKHYLSFNRHNHPIKQVRVIKPNELRDNWGIFFKE